METEETQEHDQAQSPNRVQNTQQVHNTEQLQKTEQTLATEQLQMTEQVQETEQVQFPQPRCLVSTNAPLTDAEVSEADKTEGLKRPGYHDFHSAQWTPDGSSVITHESINNLRTYIIPPDVLEKPRPQHLTPYASCKVPEPIYAFAAYPGFNLQETYTTLVLSSIRDLPIRLTNALAESPGPNLADASESKSNIVASYRLVNKYTDAYIAPHSLLFTRSGSHFVAGSDSLISVFDTGRLDSGPVQQQKTIPSKNTNLKGGGVGVKGLVSALNINNEGMLAFGTYNRHVGLYSNEGRGESVAVFTVAHDKDRLAAKELDEVAGYGVTQVAWSPCSRYLYVAERKSDVVQIYDIRVSGRLLGWLRGRNAQTHQRLGVQVVPCEDGHEVWAGGVDGVARVWRNPHESAGAGEPSFEWKAHDAPVTSTLVHDSGLLVVTASAENKNASAAVDDFSHDDSSDEDDESDSDRDEDEDDEASSSDASSDSSSGSVEVSPKLLKTKGGLKVWALG